jgi:type VI secretion system protein ImpG
MSSQALLKYYENELEFLINSGKMFAQQYPDLAKHLNFSSFLSNDPDMQRLIESVAFLNARLQKRLDEHSPEIAKEILHFVYPQLCNPIPSFSIMKFIKKTYEANGTNIIPKNTTLTLTRNNQQYFFKTTMNVTIHSCDIENIRIMHINDTSLQQTIYSLCNNVISITFDKISDVNELIFFIHMPMQAACAIYEAVTSLFQNKNTPIFENAKEIGEIECVGFENCDLFPAAKNENEAYKTLMEYNVFPQKFLFFKAKFHTQPQKEILIPINTKKEIFLKKGDLLLNCTPAINLFDKMSEPIAIDNKQIEYNVFSDRNKQKDIAIHSIESIEDTRKQKQYIPYFSHNHSLGNEDTIFWETKRYDNHNFNAWNTVISLIAPNTNIKNTVLCAKLLCLQTKCNEEIGPEEKWTINNMPGNIECINLDRPTPYEKYIQNSETLWRLVSMLSINYFGFHDRNALEFIKELLEIYNFSKEKNIAINEILDIRHETTVTSERHSIMQQANIIINANNSQSQTFLFARVLGEFFRNSVEFNTKLQVVLKNNNKVQKQWQII